MEISLAWPHVLSCFSCHKQGTNNPTTQSFRHMSWKDESLWNRKGISVLANVPRSWHGIMFGDSWYYSTQMLWGINHHHWGFLTMRKRRNRRLSSDASDLPTLKSRLAGAAAQKSAREDPILLHDLTSARNDTRKERGARLWSQPHFWRRFFGPTSGRSLCRRTLCHSHLEFLSFGACFCNSSRPVMDQWQNSPILSYNLFNFRPLQTYFDQKHGGIIGHWILEKHGIIL